MYAEFAGAIQSVKTLSEVLKAAQHLANYNELAAAVSEVSAKLLDAQNVAFACNEKRSELGDRIRDLENKIVESEDYKSQLERFQLYAFPDTGALAYALKEGMDNGEPAHYLCAACVDKRQISKLQPNGYLLKCHFCSLQIITSTRDPSARNKLPRNPMTI